MFQCANATPLISIFSGYIAPEYASRGLYSLKTDVFSFGVLVLAIISGRKNTIMERQGDTVGNLVRDVSKHTFQACTFVVVYICVITSHLQIWTYFKIIVDIKQIATYFRHGISGKMEGCMSL